MAKNQKDLVGKSGAGGNNHPQGKNYIMAIAINDYSHSPKLTNCVKDANDFIDTLVERYQFQKENVFKLYDKKATRKNIFKKFKDLRKVLTKEDNLVIYYSGHGENEDNVGYWIPIDGKDGEEWNYFSVHDLLTRLNVLDCFHIFLIVDACFSGALFERNKSGKKGGTFSKPSRWGLTASDSTETASDGKVGANSPFAKKLIGKLKTSQTSLSIIELSDFVIKEVVAVTDGNQTPVYEPLSVRGHKNGGQYIFKLKIQNEDVFWESCLKENKIESFLNYLDNFGSGQYVEEAEWQIALIKNDIKSYNKYLKKYSGGGHKNEAVVKIRILEGKEKWQEVENSGTISAYWDYIFKFPEGDYVEEARSRIDQMMVSVEEEPRVTPTGNNNSSSQNTPPIYGTPMPMRPDYEMIRVDGGSFTMGDENHSTERPTHKVTIDAFEIGKYPVTFALFDRYCEEEKKATPAFRAESRGDYPVIKVNWFDAIGFANWLSRQEGLSPVYDISGTGRRMRATARWYEDGFRLPTEAEWEFAARGGSETQGFYFPGGNNLSQLGWYNQNSNRKLHKVGLKQFNELEINDLGGNTFEWCWNWYTKYKRDTLNNPKGPASGSSRVIRGGSWKSSQELCRSSARGSINPYEKKDNIGFRLVRSLR